ncbi:Animal haem peroxidase [Methylobacterium sp. 4-46]|uniref:peroxidase family protein n=1 Tax=unclassified Methylobacterium TaxID=2615210 RepID=UPI000165C590|nr:MULTISPECIES: peroxidase family protein [Methylobacterium]ACA16122.1 Animal haem peroxidase [Methylobacterium sp. 4-46]WFT81830.1 peroxidase family protein [Methylobacterium nodulans]
MVDSARDTSRDGLRNTIETFLLTRGRPFWQVANRQPWLARLLNRLIVDNAVRKAPMRPLRLSTMAPYSSWSSLTDRTWFSRYAPPGDLDPLPPLDAVARLFVTRPEGPRLSTRSTLLFPSFAQWFTDGFLMTDPADTRRTRTNHQIDLSQIYGLTEAVQAALRRRSEARGERGRLLSEMHGGEEWAPRLFDPEGRRDPRFSAVPDPVKMPDTLPPERKATLFAFGGERANATLFTAAINTLFLREHNRLCGVLEAAEPDWDDERIFQTARAINIVQLIKVVVEEYINHISPYWFRLLADPTPCYGARWNRENWIPVEFNLLYRWHSLVPERVRWRDGEVPMAGTRFGNGPLLAEGLGAALHAASATEAWRLGLFNTAEMLREVERASVQQGRTNRLASYNDYRELMNYPRITRFEQISGDPDVVAALRDLYGTVDRIEFFVGLFAEDLPPRAAVPPLIGRMVAADAFSHALTNPLLSPQVYNADTFTRAGMACIAETSTLRDIAARNLPGGGRGLRITMDHPLHRSSA